jgi:hypothetical protein
MIDEVCITKSINFIKSIPPEEQMDYWANIRQLQPHACLTALAMVQEGVSVCKFGHAIYLLMVMHHAFYANCRYLPLITPEMLREALEGNAAMLQAMKRGLLAHDKAILSYPERTMLMFIISYVKLNHLGVPCKENEILLTRIKVVLDAYVNAKNIAANNINLH